MIFVSGSFLRVDHSITDFLLSVWFACRGALWARETYGPSVWKEFRVRAMSIILWEQFDIPFSNWSISTHFELSVALVPRSLERSGPSHFFRHPKPLLFTIFLFDFWVDSHLKAEPYPWHRPRATRIRTRVFQEIVCHLGMAAPRVSIIMSLKSSGILLGWSLPSDLMQQHG